MRRGGAGWWKVGQSVLLHRANLQEKVSFDQNLRGEGVCLEDVLCLGEDHSSRRNRQCVPKMEGKGMSDGRPVRSDPGETMTWTRVAAVQVVRRGRILGVF